jgi:hypothetical protein
MKKILCGLFLTAALVPAAANASEFVFGAKAGLYKIDKSAYDPALMISGQVAYEFLDLALVDIAVEAEAGITATDGDVSIPGADAEFSAHTIGLYLSARTAGPVYAIARAGVARTSVEVEASASNLATVKQDTDETGMVVGAGIGFSLGIRTEVELTRYSIDDKTAFYLSGGVAF